jgi:hypothetical protein
MHKNLRSWLIAGIVLVTAASCSSDDDVQVKGKYENGFLIVSEGNYNTRAGDLNYYDYDADSIYPYVYSAENPGKTIGTTTSTVQFGTFYNGKLYLVGKFGSPMVVTDVNTLKETGRIDSLPGGDGRAFVGVDNTKGLLSTINGVYPVNLSDVTLGTKLPAVSGEVTDMLKSGNYIFALSVTDGIVALKTSDLTLAKKLGTAVAGFVQGKDGSVWAASKTQLKKINPATLDVDSITTGFPVYYNEYTYVNSSMAASTADNSIFIVSGGQDKVYRYMPGDAGSLGAPFITLPAGQYTYSKGIAYDAARNYLIVNTNSNIYGADVKNNIYIHNASNGTQVRAKSYEGYYFPGMTITRP